MSSLNNTKRYGHTTADTDQIKTVTKNSFEDIFDQKKQMSNFPYKDAARLQMQLNLVLKPVPCDKV